MSYWCCFLQCASLCRWFDASSSFMGCYATTFKCISLYSIRDIDMICNVTKTICMVFDPQCRHKLITNSFPLFKLGSSYIHFVDCFKYLGHIISDNARDDDDIKREVAYVICLCAQMFSFENFIIVHVLLKPLCLNRTVCVCMMSVCGVCIV